MRAVGYQHPASLDHPQHSLDSQELPDPQDLLNSQHLADPEYQLSPEYLVDPKDLVDPEYLVDIELPDPSPGADDLLVRVEAVAVNPVDVKVRRRELPPPGGWRLLGWDAVGRVEALGQRAGGFAVGDWVWYAGALNRAGCNAELHLVDWRLVAQAPQSLRPAEAAALPLTSLTAWELLFDRLRLPQGADAAAGAPAHRPHPGGHRFPARGPGLGAPLRGPPGDRSPATPAAPIGGPGHRCRAVGGQLEPHRPALRCPGGSIGPPGGPGPDQWLFWDTNPVL